MSVVRMGSTKKFADNWDKVFGGSTGSKKKATGRSGNTAKKVTKKKAKSSTKAATRKTPKKKTSKRK